MGAYNFGGDICASALIIGLFFTFKVKYCRVPSRLGFHVATFTPVVQFFGEAAHENEPRLSLLSRSDDHNTQPD